MLLVVFQPARRIEGQRRAVPSPASRASRVRVPTQRRCLPALRRASAQLAPGAVTSRPTSHARSVSAALGIEQRALGIAAQAGRGRHAGRGYRPGSSPSLAHLRRRRRRAVDVAARAAAGIDHAAQQADAASASKSLAAQPVREPRCRADIELGRNLGALAQPLRTTAASARSPRASDSASTRIDLPAPVSPVSAPKPAAKLEFEPIDDDEIADEQAAQHRCASPSACGVLAPVQLLAQHGEVAVAGRMQQGHVLRRARHAHAGRRRWTSKRILAVEVHARVVGRRSASMSIRLSSLMMIGRLDSACGHSGTSAMPATFGCRIGPSGRQRIGGRTGRRRDDHAVGAQVVDELAVDLDRESRSCGRDRPCSPPRRCSARLPARRARHRARPRLEQQRAFRR